MKKDTVVFGFARRSFLTIAAVGEGPTGPSHMGSPQVPRFDPSHIDTEQLSPRDIALAEHIHAKSIKPIEDRVLRNENRLDFIENHLDAAGFDLSKRPKERGFFRVYGVPTLKFFGVLTGVALVSSLISNRAVRKYDKKTTTTVETTVAAPAMQPPLFGGSTNPAIRRAAN